MPINPNQLAMYPWTPFGIPSVLPRKNQDRITGRGQSFDDFGLLDELIAGGPGQQQVIPDNALPHGAAPAQGSVPGNAPMPMPMPLRGDASRATGLPPTGSDGRRGMPVDVQIGSPFGAPMAGGNKPGNFFASLAENPMFLAGLTTLGGQGAGAGAYMANSALQGRIARETAEEKRRIAAQGGPPTDDMREYQLARSQGYTGSFQDYMLGMKRAGATSVSNTIQTGEDAFAKAVGTEQGKRFVEIAQGGMGAKEMVADLNALREIGSRITTGKTAEVLSALGPYASALGVNVEGLDDMQAYKSIVAKLAPRMRVPGSGATSDYEMRSFLEALPGLGKQPGGNAIIANTLEAIQQTKIVAAEIASRAISGEITRAQAEKLLRELPDPLTHWKQTRGKSPAAPSIEDIDAELRRRGLAQ